MNNIDFLFLTASISATISIVVWEIRWTLSRNRRHKNYMGVMDEVDRAITALGKTKNPVDKFAKAERIEELLEHARRLHCSSNRNR